jgi:MGT family glycosyltransferase
MKKKFLIVTIEGGGNIPPVLHTIRSLQEKGHSVYLLSEPWFRELAESNGVIFIPFREYFTKTERKKDILEDWKDKNNSFKIMFGAARIVVNETMESIRNYQIDVVIADMLTPGALIAAEIMNIPKAMLFHMPEYLPGPNRPPGGLGLLPHDGVFGRLRDKLLERIFHLIFDKYLPVINAIRKEHNLFKFKHLAELFHSADLRIIQTSKSFDFPIVPAPKNVWYSGPILDDPDWAGEHPIQWSKEDKRPLVVIAFSSTFQNQKQVIQNCIHALSNLEVRGLVTLGPAMELEKFNNPTGNVQIIANASHARIFPDASCVITHAGHGTVMRALVNGVPLICLPMGRDQGDNAAKVVYHDAGIKLSKEASPTKIRKAVSTIINSPTYKLKAINIGAKIKSDAQAESVATALESLLSKT